MRIKGTPSIWEVSSAMQTQARKRSVVRRTTLQTPAQTHAAVFNSNNRPHNNSLPMVRYRTVNYLFSGMTNNEPVTKETNNETEYFLTGPNKENDKRASAKITKQIQKKFKEVFTGIGCFEGTF